MTLLSVWRRFPKKLRLAQYADSSIYNYRLKIAQAVLYLIPRVLSQEQMKRLISLCDLYDKALLSTIYDCALRVSEACSLKWDDISFDRQQVFVYQGKGKKDRCVSSTRVAGNMVS